MIPVCVAVWYSMLQCCITVCCSLQTRYNTHTGTPSLSHTHTHTHMCMQIPQSDQTPRFCSPTLYMFTTHMWYTSTAHMIDVCVGKWWIYLHRYVCVRVCVYTTPCAHKGMPTNPCIHPYGRKHTHKHTHSHVHTHIWTYTYIYTRVRMCTHAVQVT